MKIPEYKQEFSVATKISSEHEIPKAFRLSNKIYPQGQATQSGCWSTF